MSELPKLRDLSWWINSREIQDGSDDVVRLLGNSIEIEGAEGHLSAYTSDVIALLDANNLNTTANELRKELEALREKLKRVEVVAGCLRDLAGEFWMRACAEQSGTETLKLVSATLLDTEQTIREALK